MAEASNIVLEGVFAIKKPPSLSSAQVLRDLQQKFAESRTFAPLLRQTEQRLEISSGHRRKRRRVSSDNVFKMGHGGTLDPLATGVLIVGIGRGTKHLSSFLECTKTYETVVLFGKDTDTYDVAGKVVAEAPSDSISKALVEEKLASFRGRIKQVPPLYSALKIQGMKAYEYARTGKELPRELESRDMKVDECVMVDWYEPGQHDYQWPASEASEEDKAAAHKLMRLEKRTVSGDGQQSLAVGSSTTINGHEEHEPDQLKPQPTENAPVLPSKSKEELNSLSPQTKKAMHTHDVPILLGTPATAPAVRVRLTVSSGFYVRSFAHDLGVACGSFATMSELIRTRQAEYVTGDPATDGLVPCLTYTELDQGEEVWGSKLSQILTQWMEKNPAPSSESRTDDRDRTEHQGENKYRGNQKRGQGVSRRRNSSSPE